MTDLPRYYGPRFKLELGKFPIQRIIDKGFGVKEFSIRVNQVTLAITCPRDADLREGDLLSLYTEVALNAKPSEPPKQ